METFERLPTANTYNELSGIRAIVSLSETKRIFIVIQLLAFSSSSLQANIGVLRTLLTI